MEVRTLGFKLLFSTRKEFIDGQETEQVRVHLEEEVLVKADRFGEKSGGLINDNRPGTVGVLLIIGSEMMMSTVCMSWRSLD